MQQQQQQHQYNYPYATVYLTPPWCGFSSSIARQPRGCQYRTLRLRKALGEMFLALKCGDIERGKSTQGEGVIYTVLHGIIMLPARMA